VAVAALAGLGIYLARVGLDDADKLASVIGLFVALAGLAVAVYGLVAERRGSGSTRQRARATGRGRVNQAGRDLHAGSPPPAAAGDGGTGPGDVGQDPHNVQQSAKATGEGRINQAGRDQTITEQ
jgi:hypothetical protein